METNITLETFISTCDDMLIAQEGAMDILKRVGKTAVNLTGWRTISDMIMRLVEAIKSFFRSVIIKKKTKGGIPLQIPKRILSLYEKVFAVTFGNINLMEVEATLNSEYMDGHFKSKNNPFRQLMSTKKSEFANYDYSEFVKYDFSTKFEPLLKRFENELSTSRLAKIGTNISETLVSTPLISRLIIKTVKNQTGKTEATAREVQDAFALAQRYCSNVVKIYNYRISAIMKVFALSTPYKDRESTDGNIYDQPEPKKEYGLARA